jgi:predicted phage terminase large subunit-like protein
MDWPAQLDPRLVPPTHLQPFVDVLEKAPHGRLRVCCSVPPRHFKTVTASAAVSWWLRRDPTLRIMYVSYGARLAQDKSRLMRSFAREAGVELSEDVRAKHHWLTPQGGGVIASGIGGDITGHGCDILLVDDPVKNRSEAESATIRDRTWDWYTSTALTRLEPDGSAVIIQCVAGDQRVPLVDGPWVRIDEVEPGALVWAFGPGGFHPRRITAKRVSGVDDTLTIKTDRHSLTVNAQHPILVIPECGAHRPAFAPVWRLAGDIRRGDRLVTMADVKGRTKPPVAGWASTDRAWLLGFLLGDGWVTSWARRNWDKTRERYYESRSWCVCAALGVDEDLNAKVSAALEAAFGRKPRRTRHGYLRIDSNQAGRDLESLGLTAGVGALGKRVPGWVMGASSRYQRAFLRGFLAADGTKPKAGNAFVAGSANEQLMHDLRRLAMVCGVRPTNVHVYAMTAQPPNSPEPVESQICTTQLTFPEHDKRGHTLVAGLPDGVRVDRVRSVETSARQEVWDLSVDGPANFVCEGVVVHNTRWHEEDLAGKAIAEGYEEINLPAWDERGYPLAPDRFTRDDLERVKREVGAYDWESLYMGRPRPKGGKLFADVITTDTAPPEGTYAIGVDLAQTARTSSDWSVAVVLCKDRRGRITVVDVERAQERLSDVTRDGELVATGFNRRIARLQARYPGSRTLWLVGGREDVVAELMGELGTCPVAIEAERAVNDKWIRAQSYAAKWNEGGVAVLRAPWTDDFVREHVGFTGLDGGRDDQVDAAVAAYRALAGNAVPNVLLSGKRRSASLRERYT